MSVRLIIASAFCLGLTAPANAEVIRLSIGSGHPPTAAWVETTQKFFVPEVTRRAAEAGFEIEWTEAYGGSVCKLGECLEATQLGLLDVGHVVTPFDPSKLMANNFSYFVPFGPSDPRLASKVFWEVYERVPKLKTRLSDEFNQVYIGVGAVGNYGLSTTFAWSNVDQLVGHKIAAAGPNLPWLEGTGLVPVQTNLNEAYTALQTGVYDGWIMFPDAVVSFKLSEVAKHFADMDFGASLSPLITMNRDAWNDLPEKVQQIFLEVGRDWNVHNGKVIAEKQEAALETMRGQGVTIVDVPDDQKAAWAKSLPNLPKIRTEEINAAGQPGEAVYTYVEVAQEMGHTFARDWLAER